MNQIIFNLQKRQSRVLKIRNTIKWNHDKEDTMFDLILNKADRVLHVIGLALKLEYKKLYLK